MDAVMILSPYWGRDSADQPGDVQYARDCMRDAIARGEVPFAPHLLYPQLDEIDRSAAAELTAVWERRAHNVAVYVDRGPGWVGAVALSDFPAVFRTLGAPGDDFETWAAAVVASGESQASTPGPTPSAAEADLARRCNRLATVLTQDGAVRRVQIVESTEFKGVEIAIDPYEPKQVQFVRKMANKLLPGELSWAIVSLAPPNPLHPNRLLMPSPFEQGGSVVVPPGATHAVWCFSCREVWFVPNSNEENPPHRCTCGGRVYVRDLADFS